MKGIKLLPLKLLLEESKILLSFAERVRNSERRDGQKDWRGEKKKMMVWEIRFS